MKQVQAWAWITALLVAVLLVACGGGPPPPPTPTVEQSTPQQTASPEPAVATLVVAPSTVVLEATSTSTPEPSPTAAPTSSSPAPIQIEGSPEFVAWTNEALELLRTQAPEWYEQVFASIRTIRSVPAGSGMDVFGKVFKVGDITAYAPGFPPEQQLIWYAGSIVHDSCHSERFDQGLVYQGRDGELACLQDQKAALLLIETSSYFSDYVQSYIDGVDDPSNAYWATPTRHW